MLEQDNRVVAYARSLTKAEKHYSVIQKECLVIAFGTKQFRHYLLDGHSSCKLIMLLYNGCQNKMEGMLYRWALALQEYNFVIEYNPGSQNANADALSRLCCCISKDESCSLTSYKVSHCLSRDSLYHAQRNDTLISQLCKRMSHSESPHNATSSVVHRYVQLWPTVDNCRWCSL